MGPDDMDVYDDMGNCVHVPDTWDSAGCPVTWVEVRTVTIDGVDVPQRRTVTVGATRWERACGAQLTTYNPSDGYCSLPAGHPGWCK